MDVKKLVEEYKQAKEKGEELPFLTDHDVIQRNHQFLREPSISVSAEAQQALQLYDSLYKELCVADLSAYRQGRLGLRWRTQEEVLAGKGDQVCAALHCSARRLKALEVNFAYTETGERKNALVQIHLCGKCRHRLRHARRISQE